jgi:hypothetical protein
MYKAQRPALESTPHLGQRVPGNKADRQEHMEISSVAFIFSQFCTYFQHIYKFHSMGHIRETRGDAGGCCTALQAGRSRV